MAVDPNNAMGFLHDPSERRRMLPPANLYAPGRMLHDLLVYDNPPESPAYDPDAQRLMQLSSLPSVEGLLSRGRGALEGGVDEIQSLIGRVRGRIRGQEGREEVETLVHKHFPANAHIAILANIGRESSYNPHAVNRSSGAEGLFQFLHSSIKGPYKEWLKFNDREDDAESQVMFVSDLIYGNKARGFVNPTKWKGNRDSASDTIGEKSGREIRDAFKGGWREGVVKFRERFERPENPEIEDRKRIEIGKEWARKYYGPPGGGLL